MNNDTFKEESNGKPKGPIVWLKRFGVVGFLLFLIKGLAWVAFAVFTGKALFD